MYQDYYRLYNNVVVKIRQILWAFDNVRKRVRKLYGDRNQKLFKHSKRLLIKRSSKLKDYEKELINAMIYISDELRQAYCLREAFYTVIDAQTVKKPKKAVQNIMNKIKE